MTDKPNSERNEHGEDPVWDLLRRDAATRLVQPTPWFAARTVAKALQVPQTQGIFWYPSMLRRLLPVPIAALAAAIMIAVHFAPHTHHFVSSENEFEQHMEMLASTE